MFLPAGVWRLAEKLDVQDGEILNSYSMPAPFPQSLVEEEEEEEEEEYEETRPG